MIITRTTAQVMPAIRLSMKIMIVARDPEENAMTPMMIAACTTGLVLISKAIFMPRAAPMGGEERRELQEGGRKSVCTRRRNPGTVPTAEVTATAPLWFVARAQKPAGEEVSISLLDTALTLY